MGGNQPTAAVHLPMSKSPPKIYWEEGQGFTFAMKGLTVGVSISPRARWVRLKLPLTVPCNMYYRSVASLAKPWPIPNVWSFKLCRYAHHLVSARQMVRLAAYHLDSNRPMPRRIVRWQNAFATDLSLISLNQALQLHGGYGYLQEYPLERHVRDLRVHQTWRHQWSDADDCVSQNDGKWGVGKIAMNLKAF